MVERPTLHSWSDTHTPNSSPCRQTVRLRCDDQRCTTPHRPRTVRSVVPLPLSTPQLESQPVLLSERCSTTTTLAHTGGPCAACEGAPLGRSIWRVPDSTVHTAVPSHITSCSQHLTFTVFASVSVLDLGWRINNL